MATVVTEIVDFLTTNFPGETIRGGFMPDGEGIDDRIVAVVEIAGEEPPAETFVGAGRGPKLNMELPNLGIRCRTPKDCYEDSRQLAEDIYVFLHNQVAVILGGTRYAVIEAIQAPYNIGTDEQGRWICGFDFRCWKKKS
jgi:hypothetical protein